MEGQWQCALEQPHHMAFVALFHESKIGTKHWRVAILTVLEVQTTGYGHG